MIEDVAVSLNKLYLKRHLNIQKEVSKYDIHFGQIPIMEYILANPGCTQIEIATKLQITPASIAISTKRLQKSGMIEKEVDEQNLRCKRLHATEKGREMTKKARILARKENEKMLEGFTNQEILALEQFLKRMLENISDGPEKETDFFEMIALENGLLKKKKGGSTRDQKTNA